MDIKKICIVSTSALPWFTGTSLNPLWRSIYLTQLGHQVILFLPWVEQKSQRHIFPLKISFANEKEQLKYILDWVPEKFKNNLLKIKFYPAKYYRVFGSIYPSVTMDKILNPCEILVLEEPEHLLLFQKNNNLKKISTITLGICHTNYYHYLPNLINIKIKNIYFSLFNKLIDKIIYKNCDKVICLSKVLSYYSNSIVSPVNGVSDIYFDTNGKKNNFSKNFYFIGKLIWAKGFKQFIDYVYDAKLPKVDIFGDGPDSKYIENYALQKKVNLNFLGTISHPKKLFDYKIFINPSISEVLCTTTMEALAMGKFVIIPEHISNNFFYSFQNCLIYSNYIEFYNCLQFALNHEPVYNKEELLKLSWGEATKRLISILQT